MRVGDIHEAELTKLGAQGDGLGTLRGQPLYVPLGLPGETVKVKLARAIGDGFQADLLEVVTPSSLRVQPPCPHYSHCGGCSLQHLEGAAYLEHKQAVVSGALRQHRLGSEAVLPILGLSGPTRRRLTLAAVGGKNRTILGFNARASATVVDVQSCLIARPELVRVLPLLRTALADWFGKVRTLDLSLTLASNGLDLLLTGPEPDLVAREAIAALSNHFIRISWRKSERSEPEPMLMHQPPTITLGGIPVAYPAGTFLQPSLEGEAELTRQVQRALEGVSGRVADLFSGLGTFALPLLKTHDVVAYDSDGAAMTALAATRQPRLTTEARDLFREPLSARELTGLAAVVIDPPRAGAQAQCATLAQSDIPVIAMVSCNPGTFARDALTLISGGYRLDWVQPIDQFLWSSHVELVARFSR